MRRLAVFFCLVLAFQALGVAWGGLNWGLGGRWWAVVGSPVIRGGAFFVLGLAALRVGWGLWRRQGWAARFFPWLMLTWALFEGLWRLAYAQGPFARGRLLWVGVTSTLGVCYCYWLGWRLEKRFLEHTHE
jgi:hypothetical protein